MKLMKRKYFGTNGIRGEIGKSFTPEFVLAISEAIACFFNKGPIIVGSDARLSSPFIKKIVIGSFLSSGIEVIDLGLVPTPVVQFAVVKLKAKGGVVITASHNPPQFNGIKVIDSDGIEIGIEKQIDIERLLETKHFTQKNWKNCKDVTKMNIISEYISNIISLVDADLIKKKKLRAVVDPANSVGGLVTPKLLSELGIKVFTINAQLDGNFPGRGVEPSPETLDLMGELAKKTDASFAVAHDGDADRAIFGDEKGRVYYGDKTIALFEREILKNKQNKKFVTPVSSSKIMQDVAETIDAEVIWTPVGCIYVSRQMLKEKSILGGEENGGLFYAPHLSVRDGAMSAALMAEILANTEKTLSDLLQELPQYYQRKEKIQCPQSLKGSVMNYIKNNIKETDEIITIDGLKIIHPDGWILIRPSGTEPILRIFAEAESEERTNQIMNEGLKIIKKALRN